MPATQAGPRVRGIRGAITAEADTHEAIVGATDRLLRAMMEANRLDVGDIAAAFFTTTEDLNAEFPAVAGRALGWNFVPLLCAREIPVPGSLRSCIRVLLLVNTSSEQASLHHVYLDGAASLRPDISGGERA